MEVMIEERKEKKRGTFSRRFDIVPFVSSRPLLAPRTRLMDEPEDLLPTGSGTYAFELRNELQ